MRELSGSALFGARFRENAARALLLPARLPGQAHAALAAAPEGAVAARGGQALRPVPDRARDLPRVPADVLDLPGLEELLRGLHTRELSLVEVETQRASPFASSLLFDYVATYMYEGDTPNAERRAAALSLDRDLLRELLGQEELRELIDPGALEEVEADLQRTSERTRAANSDGLHDVLRAVGDLTADEAQARCLPAVGAAAHPRRAREGPARRSDADRRRGALDRGGGRRALPRRARRRAARRPARRVPRGGRRAAVAAGAALRPHPRPVHHARALGPLRGRLRAGAARAGARRPARARRAAPRRQRARVVRPGRAAPPAPRLAGEPPQGGRARRAARARALPARLAGRGRSAARRRRRRSPARDARAAPGPGAGAGGLGARRAPAPRGRLLARLDGPALRERRAGVGGRGSRWAAARAAWRSCSARTPAGSGRRPTRASRSGRGRSTSAIRERLERGAAFWTDLRRGPRRRRAG